MKGRPGFSLPQRALASLALALAAQPAAARDTALPFHIETSALPTVVAAIARRGDLEIVSLEPRLGTITVSARTLPGEPIAALKAVLRGTGYLAVRVGPRSFRIERVPTQRRSVAAAIPPNPVVAADDITVVGGKFPTRPIDYPGSVVRLPAAGSSLRTGAQLADLNRLSPVVFATAFGDGRDKFFIRGIADSSFNGASQPTTAIYFDDAPVSFGSPNPNLRLYDVAAVEVLEGPQGTLYGAGSIGGVIHVIPRSVDLNHFGGIASGAAEVMGNGSMGWKLGGAVNLPVVQDAAGLRLVGYSERNAGYIDDPLIGADINRVNVAGGRGALAVDLPSNLRLDASVLYQHTQADDAQYAEGPPRTAQPLARGASLPQPYHSELVLGRVALRKQWDNAVEFTSSLSFGHRSSFDRFDATQDLMGTGASVYDLQRSSRVWTSETRIGRQGATGVSWVAAVMFQHITDGQSRAFGIPNAAPTLDEVTNKAQSASAFVQARIPLNARLDATMGLRYTVARTDSEPARGNVVSFVRGDTARHFDPTIALLWRASARVALFGRYQTGYRNGGVSVARGIGRVADFKPDSIAMVEVGIRRPRRGASGFDLSAAVSYSAWNNVLAELVTRRGTPITDNTGNARLLSLEADVNWIGSDGWRFGGSLLYTDNSQSGALAGQPTQPNRRLPDTPNLSARVQSGFEWRGPGGYTFSIDAFGRYVGRSDLGPGSLLDLSQGDYALIDLRAGVKRNRIEAWLALDNLMDCHANRFALGNPLLLYRRQGFAPVTPRRLSLGFSLSY